MLESERHCAEHSNHSIVQNVSFPSSVLLCISTLVPNLQAPDNSHFGAAGVLPNPLIGSTEKTVLRFQTVHEKTVERLHLCHIECGLKRLRKNPKKLSEQTAGKRSRRKTPKTRLFHEELIELGFLHGFSRRFHDICLMCCSISPICSKRKLTPSGLHS